MRFHSLNDIESYLEGIPKFQDRGPKAARFDIRYTKKLSEAVGSPHEALNAIHVAGTNGKGSTCRLLAAVYHAAGYKTGLYTSPHLLRWTERFRTGSGEIPEEALLEFFNSRYPVIEELKPTYFELTTVIAFWWFAREEVDLAIIETGLGGRLDATNIIRPLASVITNVSLDHTDLLGGTVEEIAREKAGIIKPGVPVITGNMSTEALEVVREQAAARGSEVYESADLAQEMAFGMNAPVQRYNIAMARKTVTVLQSRFPVGDADFARGIEQTGRSFPSGGRFEQLAGGRPWYFDGAHNLEAVRAMKEMVGRVGEVGRATLVLAMMSDKVHKKVTEEFLEFKKIFYHTLDTERAARLDDLKPLLPGVKPFPAEKALICSFLKENESELVIFAGSFYFYSTVRDWISHCLNNR